MLPVRRSPNDVDHPLGDVADVGAGMAGIRRASRARVSSRSICRCMAAARIAHLGARFPLPLSRATRSASRRQHLERRSSSRERDRWRGPCAFSIWRSRASSSPSISTASGLTSSGKPRPSRCALPDRIAASRSRTAVSGRKPTVTWAQSAAISIAPMTSRKGTRSAAEIADSSADVAGIEPHRGAHHGAFEPLRQLKAALQQVERRSTRAGQPMAMDRTVGGRIRRQRKLRVPQRARPQHRAGGLDRRSASRGRTAGARSAPPPANCTNSISPAALRSRPATSWLRCTVELGVDAALHMALEQEDQTGRRHQQRKNDRKAAATNRRRRSEPTLIVRRPGCNSRSPRLVSIAPWTRASSSAW